MNIRPARPTDIPAMLALLNEHVRRGDVLPRTEASIRDTLPDWLVGIDADGDLVACVSLLFYTDALAEVRSLAVDDKVKGLRQGGDDYLTKPFAFAELLARAELLIKRGGSTRTIESTLFVDDLKMDLLAHRVTRAGREIDLQPKEFQLLRYLMEHKGQVVSRTLLFEAVWDYHFDPKTNVIDVHIAKLRKKIEDMGGAQLIHTVRGAGYVVRR